MATMKKKDKKLLTLSEQLEKNYIKNLQAEYVKAYQEMKIVINDTAAKYAVGGELTRTEIYKYNRFQKLQSQLLHGLKELGGQPQTAAYLTDQYQLNYFYSGYILETDYQIKLAYANIPRSTISRGVLTPMSKISLKNNKVAVAQKIQSSLVQSIAQGEGVRGLTGRIKKDLENNANNAVRIARTESTRVQNWAKQDSYDHAAKRKLPIRKQWVSALDAKTRDSHALLDGEIVKLDQTFSNGLMFPGDQGGPPEETINCRCTMITVLDGYDNAYEYRRARGVEGNEVIPYTNYQDWERERVA